MSQETFETPQPLIVHLLELRKRLLITVGFFLGAFGVSYCFAKEIFDVLVYPLAQVLGKEGLTGEGGPRRLIYTGMAEAFLTYVKVALFSALFFSLPLLCTQIWRFVAPGLYQKEQRAVRPFLVATPFLFALGACFAYFIIIPAAWTFFVQFETQAPQTFLPIQLEARIGEYLSLVMHLLLAFGLSFQLPVCLVLLARVGLVKASFLRDRRRYAFILILGASAFLTPPDVLSMLGLALPLYGLFELSIGVMSLVERKASIEEGPLEKTEKKDARS